MSDNSSRYPQASTSRSQARAADKRSAKHDHASCDRPPNVPDGQHGDYDGLEGERHGRLRLSVRWNEVTSDTIGNPIRLRRYVLEWQSTKDDGASWRDAGRAQVPAKADDDAADKATYIIHKIRGRLGYRWRVRAEAQGWCQSDWSSWRDEGEAVETPPALENLTLDIDEHVASVTWTIPADLENPDVKDLRVTHVDVELFKDSVSDGNRIGRDTFRAGERATFKMKEPPKNKTFWVRAKAVSANGATSTPVTTSATKNTPSTPAAPAITFDAQGPRHARFRALVAVAEVADTDFSVVKYKVEFVDKRTSGTPTNGTDRDSKDVKAGGTSRELAAIFRGVAPDFFTYARVQAVDADHKESAWSSWAAGGKPSASDTIPALTNLTYITARRRVGIKWKVPLVGNLPDDRIAHVHVQIAYDNGFVSLADESYKNPGHGSHRYAVSTAEQATTFYLRVRPIDGAGNVGAWQPSATGQALTAESDLAGTQPIGTVYHWAGRVATIPAGSLWCNGNAVSRTTYAALFAVIGTDHGAGDGSTTFNLPDIRKRHIVGAVDDSEVGQTDGLAVGSRVDEHEVHGAHTTHGGHGAHDGHGGHRTDNVSEATHGHFVQSFNTDSSSSVGRAIGNSGAAPQHQHNVPAHNTASGAAHAHAHQQGHDFTANVQGHGDHGTHAAHAEHGFGEHDSTPGTRGHRRHPRHHGHWAIVAT